MVCLAVAGTAGLVACGQRGALYLPTDPAAKDRATLPQLLSPGGLGGSPASSSTPSSSAPAPTSLVAPAGFSNDSDNNNGNTTAPTPAAASSDPQKQQ